MSTILINLSKYILAFMMMIYTLLCFSINGTRKEKSLRRKYITQNVLTMLIFTVCGIIILYYNPSVYSLVFFILEFIYLLIFIMLYYVIYPDCSRLIVNNMAMLMALGFIMVERLAPQNAMKQFLIVMAGTGISFIVPRIMRKRKIIYGFRYGFAILGIIFLGITLVLGMTTWGANISVEIGGFTFQPSEFVKLIYVLFVAAVLSKAREFKHIILSAVLAAIHVLILVASTDLGTALIFFIVYIVMLFVGSGKIRYLLAGLLCGSAASVLAYKFFSHVRVRITAWKDPWSVIDGKGYQITQSLFAIGTGGWFGAGLYQGLPTKIPVVVKDFVFSAIAEEFGIIFSICVILVCFSCFMTMMKTATRCKDLFYKLIIVGFATMYIFQCFLTIGGVTKFIPLTGVTLPFVSYGGSSILCSLIMFSMVQAAFVLVKENEEDEKIITEEVREKESGNRKSDSKSGSQKKQKKKSGKS